MYPMLLAQGTPPAAPATCAGPIPAASSCIPQKALFTRRLRTYHGPAANPTTITPNTATRSLTSFRSTIKTLNPANNGTNAKKYAFVNSPNARTSADRTMLKRQGFRYAEIAETSHQDRSGTASQSFEMRAAVA